MTGDCLSLLACVLAVSSWVTPQPKLSRGLLMLYGGQGLVEANADWHGYDLSRVPGRCGLASISPVHLGQLAWVSVDRLRWIGPCLVVDVGGRSDALHMIYDNHEIAEVSRATAAALGFDHGKQGYIYFGACPPGDSETALEYRPPLRLDATGEVTPSFYPYPRQQAAESCR
jgi:hypothetical protein